MKAIERKCENCLHIHSTSQICDKCKDGSKFEPYCKCDYCFGACMNDCEECEQLDAK